MELKDVKCRTSAWQAPLPCFGHYFADKWVNSSDTSLRSYQLETKKLTTEATCVMYVILFFIMLCVTGSLINAYESFHNSFLKKKTSRKLKGEKMHVNGETKANRKAESTESSKFSVWKENFRKFIDCFSVQANASKIFGFVSKQDHMDFIDGIRTILFLTIFVVHFLLFYLLSIKNLQNHIPALLQTSLIKFFVKANFGIDAFILLSGFLNGYFFSKHFEEKNGKVSLISFYAFRIVRSTPVYMILLGFYTTLLTYMGSSPIWPTYDTNPVCKETWIWNLLYISNYSSHYNQCMSMSWFLACLMQLHLISPLFMIPLNRSPRIGLVLSSFIICSSCVLSFIITKNYNLFGYIPNRTTDYKILYARIWQVLDKMHQNTYLRLASYLTGIILGWYLNKRKLTKKSNWLTLTLGWISSVVVIYISFYALHGRDESLWESAVYNSLKDLLFSCGFSWLIFVCATKQVFIERLLSHRIFKPISRLSFCGYLTQAIIFEVYFLSNEVLVDESFIYQGMLTNLLWVPLLVRLLLWTLAVTFVVSLLFEMPVIKLLQVYFISNKNKID